MLCNHFRSFYALAIIIPICFGCSESKPKTNYYPPTKSYPLPAKSYPSPTKSYTSEDAVNLCTQLFKTPVVLEKTQRERPEIVQNCRNLLVSVQQRSMPTPPDPTCIYADQLNNSQKRGIESARADLPNTRTETMKIVKQAQYESLLRDYQEFYHKYGSLCNLPYYGAAN